MKAVVATFNQEKALVGAFSVITNLLMDHFEALVDKLTLDVQLEGRRVSAGLGGGGAGDRGPLQPPGGRQLEQPRPGSLRHHAAAHGPAEVGGGRVAQQPHRVALDKDIVQYNFAIVWQGMTGLPRTLAPGSGA